MSELLTIIRGDDVDIELTFTDKDGEPIDLTNCTVFFTAKKLTSVSDQGAIITKQVTSFTNPTTGIMILSLTNSQTDVDPGNYVYDVQLKNSGNRISSSQSGQFKILPDVTRRVEV